MRDERLIAEHRGGSLTKAKHIQLMLWACHCAEHVLPSFPHEIVHRLHAALSIARNWTEGIASVGDARSASLDCIAIANDLTDPESIAIARSVGHAVASAHMADHSLRAVEYALKAIKFAGKSVSAERKWQDQQLPAAILELVISSRNKIE